MMFFFIYFSKKQKIRILILQYVIYGVKIVIAQTLPLSADKVSLFQICFLKILSKLKNVVYC